MPTTYRNHILMSIWFTIFSKKVFICLMVFNTTFNNISVISWQSVLLMEETGVLTCRIKKRACIVHLVIKKTNWSYVKTMSCSGSQLGIMINIKNTKFVKDLPMIDAQFRFNQRNSFREEYISVFSHRVLC